MTGEIISYESTSETKLTSDQLRDLAYSGIRLINIDSDNGTSTIMDGLSSYEYSMAMTYRSIRKREYTELHKRLALMAKEKLAA